MGHQEPAKSERPHAQQRLTCPACRRPFTVPADAKIGRYESLPFCCERCKLIDLGAWLDADYRIPARPDEESEEALPDILND